MARNAIFAAGKPGHSGCGILDTDLIAAFDYLCLDWVYMVLEKKGLDKKVISRLKNLYIDNYTIIVVNNMQGKVHQRFAKYTEVGLNGEAEYIKYRVESASPTIDWERCWRLARLPGLGPDKN